MKSAISLVALIGMSALQAYAAQPPVQEALSGVPLSVAKRLNATPAPGSATLAQMSGVPMRVAARTNQPAQSVASDSTPVRLSGVRACHAKRT